MFVLPIQPQANTFLIYHDCRISIDYQLFSVYSSRARTGYCSTKSIILDSLPIDSVSLKVFADACQGRNFNLTTEIYEKVKFLANYFEVDSFGPVFENFIQRNGVEFALQCLIDANRKINYVNINENNNNENINNENNNNENINNENNNNDYNNRDNENNDNNDNNDYNNNNNNNMIETNENVESGRNVNSYLYEDYLSNHFDEFIEYPFFKIFQLPFNVINKITRPRNEERRSFKNFHQKFIQGCFQNYKEQSSILLDYFEFEDKHILISFMLYDTFKWNLVSNDFFKRMVNNVLIKKYFTLVKKKIDYKASEFSGNFNENDHMFCTEVIIKENVNQIESRKFLRCNYLKKVVFTKINVEIEDDAFGCSVDTIQVPLENNTINHNIINTFLSNIKRKMKNVSKIIYLGNRNEPLQIIGESIYTSFKNIKIINNSVININNIRFKKSLRKIDLSNSGIEIISDMAFYDCIHLNFIKLPKNLNTIGESSFSLCSSLLVIEFPDTLIMIKKSAFASCYNLSTVICKNNICEIGDGAFSLCSSLSEIELPLTITSIGKEAFSLNENLYSFHFPNFQIIKESLFEQSYLETLDIPLSVVEIQKNAFAHTHLSQIDLSKNENLRLVGEGAFSFIKPLQKIIFPKHLEIIDKETCFDCENLETVILPTDLKIISEKAFSKCPKFCSLEIPSGIQEIRGNQFSYIREVKIKEGTTILPDNIFNGFIHLKEIEFPISYTSISQYLLSNLRELIIIKYSFRHTEVAHGAFDSNLDAAFIDID